MRALGDFEPSNQSVVLMSPDALREPLTLPEHTQGIELRSLGSTAAVWGNHLPQPPSTEDWNVLLWPQNEPCPLWSQAAAIETATLTSSSDARHALLHWERGPSQPTAVSVDLERGAAQSVSLPAEIGHDAAAVAAGGSVLLLGGTRASGGGRSLGLLSRDGQSVEVLNGELLHGRTRHGALALSADRVLVAGGVDPQGTPIASVELLDGLPDTASSREIAVLAYPRLMPQLLPLGSEQVLVAGGFQPGAETDTPQPAGPLEVLRVSGSGPVAPSIVLEPAALNRAFASLGSGGVLAVGGCELVQSTEQCVPCGPAAAGCVSRSAWWITPNGTPFPLEPLPEALRVAEPTLVAGIEGSAWLLAGSHIGRFDPARAEFMLEHALGDGTTTRAASRAEPGLLLYLSSDAEQTSLQGLRYSQRSHLSPDVSPLLLGSAENVAFHRPPEDQSSGSEWLRFSSSSGLSLRGLSSGVTIAETSYAALSMTLELDPGPLPQIVLWPVAGSLQQGEVFGGTECPWPAERSSERSRSATLQRIGNRVELAIRAAAGDPSGEPTICVGSLPSRVRLSVVATGLGTSQIRSMVIQRQPYAP